jgi:hypothetical protein
MRGCETVDARKWFILLRKWSARAGNVTRRAAAGYAALVRTIPLLSAVLGCGGVLAASDVASAQQHVDAAIEAGVVKPWFSSRPTSPDNVAIGQPSFGPLVRVNTHIALLPLLRAGANLQFAYNPAPAAGYLQFGGGLDFRGILPFRVKDLRPFLGLGFSYLRVVQTGGVAPVVGSGGNFAVPISLGAVYKFRKPYEVGGSLGCDFGFGWHGAAYRAPATQGNDAFRLWATVAFGFDT